MVSSRPLPGVVRSRRALTVSLVQSSCRRYQPRGVVGALSWTVARRRSGSLMVAGVRGRCPGSGGGWAGWAAGVLRVYVDGWLALDARPDWALPGGFLGVRQVSGRCGGALETCGWRRGRVRGAERVSGRLGHARHGNG